MRITAWVARKEGRLLIAASAALRKWPVLQLDIVLVFLKSGGFDRDVFVDAPSLVGQTGSCFTLWAFFQMDRCGWLMGTFFCAPSDFGDNLYLV